MIQQDQCNNLITLGKNKYKISETIHVSFQTDLIILCYYVLYCSKVQRKYVTPHIVKEYLCQYDYAYKYLMHKEIKKTLEFSFPIYKNNHKSSKYNKLYKISKYLIEEWGQLLRIDFSGHSYMYSIFSEFDNEKNRLQIKNKRELCDRKKDLPTMPV